MSNSETVFDDTLRGVRLSRLVEGMIPDGTFEAQIMAVHRQHVEHTISHVRKSFAKVFPEIYFDFIDSPRLNALAFSCGDDLYMGINTGSVYLIMDLFYRMLSHPGLFTSVGIPAVEKIESFHADELTSNYMDMIKGRAPGGLARVIPKDPARRAFAENLAMTSFRCLVLHELGHLMRGHCSYRQAHGMPLLLEREEVVQPEASEEVNFRQLLEIDADVFAASYTTRVYMNTDIKDRPKRDMMAEFITAAAALYWLFNSEFKVDIAATHPPAVIRTIFFDLGIRGQLQEWRTIQQLGTGAMLDTWQPLYDAALNTLYTALANIRGGEHDPRIVKAVEWVNSPAGREYIRILAEAHRDKISEVLKYAPSAK